MGGNQFRGRIETELCNQQFVIIISHFEQIQSTSNKHYGQHDVYKDKSQYRLILKELIQSTQEGFLLHIQHWEERTHKYIHPNMLQVHAFYKGSGDQTCTCGNVMKVNLLIDYISSTLEDEIDTKNEYKEEELWNILDSIVSGMSFLQQNQMKNTYLKLSTIYIVMQQNGQKVYKIADSQLMSYPSLFEDLYMASPSSPEELLNVYPSPSVLRALSLKERVPTHNEYKSDVYSLGMIILQLASWSPNDDCYDWTNFRINDYFVQDKIVKQKQRFSNEFLMMVSEMLKFDESFRPDFINLDFKLNKVNALKGKRAKQSLLRTNLVSYYQLQATHPHQIQQQIYGHPPLLKQQTEKTVNQNINETAQFQQSLPLNNISNYQQQQDKSAGSPVNNNYIQNQITPQNKFSQSFNQNLNTNNSFHSQTQPLENNFLNNNYNNKPLFHQSFSHNNNNYGSFYGNNGGGMGQQNNNNYGMYNSGNNNNNFMNGYNNNNFNNMNSNNLFGNYSGHNGFFNQPFSMNNANNFGSFNNNNNEQQFGQNNMFQPNPYNKFQPNILPMSLKNPTGNFLGSSNLLVPPQNQYNNLFKRMPKTPSPRNSRVSRSRSDHKNLAQKLKYNDGSIYFGDVFNGLRHGYGRLDFQTGVYYEGSWKEDKMEGKGTLYYKKDQIAYEGEWSQDKFNNFGKYYNKNLEILKIPFDYKNLNKINNYWIKYEGDFKFDSKEGFGTLFLSNGEKFSGNFENDEANGYGTFLRLNKETISGYWEDNNLIEQQKV